MVLLCSDQRVKSYMRFSCGVHYFVVFIIQGGPGGEIVMPVIEQLSPRVCANASFLFYTGCARQSCRPMKMPWTIDPHSEALFN